MRLRRSKNSAEEEIILRLNEGYRLLAWLEFDYSQKRQIQTFNYEVDYGKYSDLVLNTWGSAVIATLDSIFPTELESNQFSNPETPLVGIRSLGMDDHQVRSLFVRLGNLLRGLDSIRTNSLSRYTDLPLTTRLYVEDIDSFAKVRDVNPDSVARLLGPNGYYDVSEDTVQLGLEQILREPFHKRDWPGEYNDLYTSNVVVNGSRRATAFMLKGNGLRAHSLEIKHCGKNSDQLVRLFESPADLFIVQYVGNVSEAVIKDVEGKVDQIRARGKQAVYCILTGLDTARLLHAHGLTQ